MSGCCWRLPSLCPTARLTACFRLCAHGEAAKCEIEFAASSSALVEFGCEQEAQISYHLAVLELALKAVHVASETFLRINADGMLSVQHMIDGNHGVKGFVDALVCREEVQA